MESKTYWFITGMRDQSNMWVKESDCRTHRRSWGFFDDFKEAEKAVLMNDGDIYECEYEYMVIEGHKMGTWGSSTGERFWYKYDSTTEKFNPIETPAWAVNIVNWSIG